jgi:two-component system, NtrC family, response regulator HydG
VEPCLGDMGRKHCVWRKSGFQTTHHSTDLMHTLVGDSSAMKRTYEFFERVGPCDSTVLIYGESGTGKELAARSLHRKSRRCNKPFVAINCAAIPEGLLESELFGHERGAFTGAVGQKKGRLESANGGVVFLDEVGELAPALQVKLLRVLQEREFERVGGIVPIPLNVRLIAATNKNLEREVKARAFREDLYYRLNVVSLRMPALRERREDVATLASYFVEKFAALDRTALKEISPRALECLTSYDWPGNVRELENAIERALVLSRTDSIEPEDLPECVLTQPTLLVSNDSKYHSAIQTLKKNLILQAMHESQGNYNHAARNLGLHTNYLHRLIRNLGLRGSVRMFSSHMELEPAVWPQATEDQGRSSFNSVSGLR